MTPSSVNALRFIPAASTGKQWVIAILFLAPLIGFFSGAGWAEKPAYRVDWNHAQLSITANQAPLNQVLAEVIARTGLEARGLPSFPDLVSIEFTKLPLSAGLQKLLVGKSYFILDKKSANGAMAPGTLLFLDSSPNSAALPNAAESGDGDSEVPESLTEPEMGLAGMEAGNSGSETPESFAQPEMEIGNSGSETAELLPPPEMEPESGSSEPLEPLPQPGMETESSSADAPDRFSQLNEAISANTPDLKDKLYAATQDDEPLIRELAYQELFQRGDTTVVDLLQRDARSENIDVRRTALGLLSQLTGDKAVDALTEAASDSNIDIRQLAMENLAKNAQGVEIIKDKLRDPNPEVRMAALESLASLGNESAVEATAAALQDADEQVRSRAEAIRQELQATPASE